MPKKQEAAKSKSSREKDGDFSTNEFTPPTERKEKEKEKAMAADKTKNAKVRAYY